MEDKNIDLQVGDRVTYKSIKTNEVVTLIIDETALLNDMQDKRFFEILKIERQKYETVYEKKELLTEEEKEFLKGILKYYEMEYIEFQNENINLLDEDKYTIAYFDYPRRNLEFEGIERHKYYTLKELGLE